MGPMCSLSVEQMIVGALAPLWPTLLLQRYVIAMHATTNVTGVAV